MRLLVVEDEPALADALKTGLTRRGYTVDVSRDGLEGENLARMNPYDALVLDVMLPRRDGFTICKNLREAGVVTPVLFLTAKGEVADKVAGLDGGGDDYLAKPFDFDELAARLRSLMRRPALTMESVLSLDGLQVDPASQKVSVDGEVLALTLREYGLLEYLLRNKGTVVSRDDLLEHVWDRFFDSFSNVVDVHMKNLRKKLPKAYAERIATVWGKGYRLE